MSARTNAILDDEKNRGTRPVHVGHLHPTKGGKWIATYDGAGRRTVGLVIPAVTQQAPNGIAVLSVTEDGRGGRAVLRKISRHDLGGEEYYTAKAAELTAQHRKAIRSLAAGLAAARSEPGTAPQRQGQYDYFSSPAPADLQSWVGTEVTAWQTFEGVPGLLTEVTDLTAKIWQRHWNSNREIPLDGTTFQRAVDGS